MQVWEGVQANFEGTFYLLVPKLLAELGAGDGGFIDLTDVTRVPAITEAMYHIGLFSPSAVDNEKYAPVGQWLCTLYSSFASAAQLVSYWLGSTACILLAWQYSCIILSRTQLTCKSQIAHGLLLQERIL